MKGCDKMFKELGYTLNELDTRRKDYPGTIITEFRGKLSRKDVFYNPQEDRDLILRILNNYKFSEYNVSNMKPNVLIIFNDQEYVCTITGFRTNDKRHKYSNRLNKDGYYDWIMKDSYTVADIIKHTTIKEFLSERITIDVKQSAFGKLCDKYTYDITHGMLTHKIYSTTPENVSDPYADSLSDSFTRIFDKIFG